MGLECQTDQISFENETTLDMESESRRWYCVKLQNGPRTKAFIRIGKYCNPLVAAGESNKLKCEK